MATAFSSAVFGTNSFPAAAAAAGTPGTGAVLAVVLEGSSNSADGPSAVTFGGVALDTVHQTFARTSGLGTGAYRHVVLGLLALDDAELSGSDLAVTWSSEPGDMAQQQLLFTGVSQSLDIDTLCAFGAQSAALSGDGPYLATYQIPGTAVPEGAALLVGTMHVFTAIGGGSPAGWTVAAGGFTVADPGSTPAPRDGAAYGVALGAQTVVTTMAITAGLSSANPDVAPTYSLVLPLLGEEPVSMNCDCVDETDNQTLAELRTRILRRLGYGSTASNPPPGMAETVDEFIISAHRVMYSKYPALRTRRFFKWALEDGVRFYDLDAHTADECGFELDAQKRPMGAWVRDLNGAWLPLVYGIPPVLYTMVNQPGIPSRWELRQCIEVYPAPQATGYELWIKGQINLNTWGHDGVGTTKTGIDSELVFLTALADAKAHYGQPDAEAVATRAKSYLMDLVASTHQTRRYIPGVQALPPAIMPIFLPLNGTPA